MDPFPLGGRWGQNAGWGRGALGGGLSDYLVDPASSHMLVSKIKPCMCKFVATQQAPKHESLLRCNSKLQSVRACCCNATNSGACPALELATLQQQASELVRLRNLLVATQ